MHQRSSDSALSVLREGKSSAGTRTDASSLTQHKAQNKAHQDLERLEEAAITKQQQSIYLI